MLNYQRVGADPCPYSWNILEQLVQPPGFAVFFPPGLSALFHGEVLQQRWQSPVLGRRQRFFTSVARYGAHTQELDGQCDGATSRVFWMVDDCVFDGHIKAKGDGFCMGSWMWEKIFTGHPLISASRSSNEANDFDQNGPETPKEIQRDISEHLGTLTICGGLFDPEECILRCTKAQNCAFATMYRNGWCQLGSKCVEEAEAGDSSAMTYAKVWDVMDWSWSHVMEIWVDGFLPNFHEFSTTIGMRISIDSIWLIHFGWLAASHEWNRHARIGDFWDETGGSLEGNRPQKWWTQTGQWTEDRFPPKTVCHN